MIDTTPFKQRLEEEKATLVEELTTIARPNPSNPNEWEAIQTDTEQESDPNDQAGLLDEYQENRAIVDVLNKRYQDVQAALVRVEDGSYGVCSVDGEDIEEARLEADPTATTCIAHIA